MVISYFKKVYFLFLICGVWNLKAEPTQETSHIIEWHPLKMMDEYSKLPAIIPMRISSIEKDFEKLMSRWRYSRDAVENEILREELEILFQDLEEQLGEIQEYVLQISHSGIYRSSEFNLKLNHLRMNIESIRIDLDDLISISRRFFPTQLAVMKQLTQEIQEQETQQNYFKKITEYQKAAYKN
jgi:hypothetical protein